MQHSTQLANYQMFAKFSIMNLIFPFSNLKMTNARSGLNIKDEKAASELKYQEHQREKILSRGQKEDDKKGKENLQTQSYSCMQCPRGNT